MMKYKYHINHRLSLLPKGLYPENIIDILEREFGVQETEFNRDRNIGVSQTEEIPMERLMIYARLFSVPPEDLLTDKSLLVGT